MKAITTLILVPVFMIQTFSNWIVIFQFRWNRDYIARNLCENRFRPQMHCNGKCLLMKKMRANEGQPAQPGTLKLSEEVSLYFDDHTEYVGKFFLATRDPRPTRDQFALDNSFTADIFRPPLD